MTSLINPQNMGSPETKGREQLGDPAQTQFPSTNLEQGTQPPEQITPAANLTASTTRVDKQENAKNLSSTQTMAPNIVQENPRPCLWCTHYMASFPSSERRELDEALGEGIVCCRFKNENKASHDGVLRCLRCRSGEPYRECLPIPDTISESVLKDVEEMVKEHKAYVKERYDDESEKGQIRMARKLQLLFTPELHDCFTAIGAFSGLSKFPLETVNPLSNEEAAQIVSEVKAQVNPESGGRDFNEQLHTSTVQIPDSGVYGNNGCQAFSDSDITMATTMPLSSEDNIQALLEDQLPPLSPPTPACPDDFNSFENGDDIESDSWVDMLGEFYCDSKLVTTTNFAQEDDIYASEDAELDFAPSTFATDEALQTSSTLDYQEEHRAPIDVSGGSGYCEPMMSGALHPDDVIDENDLAMDDCVYDKPEVPHDAPLTTIESDEHSSSDFGQHHGSINTPSYPELPPSDALPSINLANNHHVSHNATTASNDNGHPEGLLGEAMGGRLSNSFVEQLLDLVNLSRSVDGKQGPL